MNNVPQIVPTVGTTLYRDPESSDGSTIDLVLGHDDILYICNSDRTGRIISSSEIIPAKRLMIKSLIYALERMIVHAS